MAAVAQMHRPQRFFGGGILSAHRQLQPGEAVFEGSGEVAQGNGCAVFTGDGGRKIRRDVLDLRHVVHVGAHQSRIAVDVDLHAHGEDQVGGVLGRIAGQVDGQRQRAGRRQEPSIVRPRGGWQRGDQLGQGVAFYTNQTRQ
ncbi:MAG: hypothetical protein R2873_35270 [Caldilineaceae bacterium]